MKDPLYQLKPVETQIYEPHPDYPGMQRVCGHRPRGRVMVEVNRKLDSIDLNTGEGGIGLHADWRPDDSLPSWYTKPELRNQLYGETYDDYRYKYLTSIGYVPGSYDDYHQEQWNVNAPALPWPHYNWLAAYVVGGSEGRWVHLAAIVRTDGEDEEHVMIGFAKTFRGDEHAQRMAAALAWLLQS